MNIDNRRGVIYRLYFSEERKVTYIGQSTNIKNRIKSHCTSSCLNQPYVKNRWLKDRINRGWILKSIVLEKDIPKDELDAREIFWIANFKERGFNLKNSTPGGKYIPPCTEASKLKAKKNRKPRIFTPEDLQKMSERMTGANSPLYGKPKSDETKLKIRLANLGKKHSAESKAKMSRSRAGVPTRPCSEETKQKIGAKNKVRYSHKYLILFPDQRTEEIINLREFCKTYNLTRYQLKSTLTFPTRNCKGYRILKNITSGVDAQYGFY